MSKKIEFDFDGKHFTLEFTRSTVTAMQRQHFSTELVSKEPSVYIPMLFAGAFAANHKYMKPDVIEKIYEKIPNRVDMVTALMEMYAEPVNAMFEDPEESEGNVQWGKNWESKD